MRRSMARCGFLGALVLVLSSCGDSADDPLFTPEDALGVARGFHSALIAGQADAAVALCWQPFDFRGRIWKTEKILRENLIRQVTDPRVGSLAGAEVEFDVFSRKRLIEEGGLGGFPLPDDGEKRARALSAKGLEADGYLVRIRSPGKTGWFLVIAPKGGFLRIRAMY